MNSANRSDTSGLPGRLWRGKPTEEPSPDRFIVTSCMNSTPILIIGAGPAGLAVAGRLRKRNLDFTLLEASDKIASSWQGHYQRLCLHTIKELSHLPHLPFPEHYPTYVPREDLVHYYEQYAQQFDIQPHFGQAVRSVKKESSNWRVETEKGDRFQADHVVFATGINRVPNWPELKGQDNFPGTISHSRTYFNPDPYVGKRVLVVGMGNTGAEIALDLSEAGIATYLSVRSPITIVPRDVNGRPVQTTAKVLAKIPFGLGDWLGTQIRKIVIGDLSKYGVPMSKVHPTVQLRETGKTPVIDLGTVGQIKNGKILVRPDIDHLSAAGVHFVDGTTEAFDHIVMATGYRAQMDDFLTDTTGLLDKWDNPKSPLGTGKFAGLYFIGFDNYKLGGILGTIFDDSKTIVEAL